jgi:hypothetical protein
MLHECHPLTPVAPHLHVRTPAARRLPLACRIRHCLGNPGHFQRR